MPTPHSESDMGEAGQSGSGSPPILPDFILADFALQNIYVLRAVFGAPFNNSKSSSI